MPDLHELCHGAYAQGYHSAEAISDATGLGIDACRDWISSMPMEQMRRSGVESPTIRHRLGTMGTAADLCARLDRAIVAYCEGGGTRADLLIALALVDDLAATLRHEHDSPSGWATARASVFRAKTTRKTA
jgi:hypothetical protein